MEGWLAAAARIDTRWLLVCLLAVLDTWCIGLIARSDTSIRQKVAWSAVVVLCPVVGCVYWYVLGPKPDLPAAEEGRPAG